VVTRALAFALLWPAAASAGWRAAMAPAPVSGAHAGAEERCDACHLKFKGIPDEKCLACHAGIATRLRDKRGWHAVQAPRPWM
jgi:hypothetical protein